MQTLRRQTKKKLPQIKMSFTYIKDGQQETTHGAKSLPRWLAVDRMKLLRVRASVGLEDLFNFYKDIHDTKWSGLGLTDFTLQLSADGVTESSSGQHKFYIISLSFDKCKAPIPWHVWEFRSKTGPTLEELFGDLVKEINDVGIHVSHVVLDGKEQNYVRGMVTTNGYYGCARCLSSGTTEKVCRRVEAP